MLSSCKGRLDLYTERISKQRSKDFKHVVFDRDTGTRILIQGEW